MKRVYNADSDEYVRAYGYDINPRGRDQYEASIPQIYNYSI